MVCSENKRTLFFTFLLFNLETIRPYPLQSTLLPYPHTFLSGVSTLQSADGTLLFKCLAMSLTNLFLRLEWCQNSDLSVLISFSGLKKYR